MPALSHARLTVGVIASRCAREATSGTTPPNRACSSTLEAIASASSVRPRTMPTPVSSQEVSIPRIRGSSRIYASRGPETEAEHTLAGPAPRIAAVPAHHDRVRPRRLVVTLPHAHLGEAEAFVELAGPVVAGAHLQEHRLAVPPPGLLQQRGQQGGTHAVALFVGPHADGLHVALTARGGEPGISDDLLAPFRARGLRGDHVMTGPRLVVQLALEHLRRPGVLGEQLMLQP